MNRIFDFLFANEIPANPDKPWFIILIIGWAALLLIIAFFGAKILSREEHKAGHKTLKKSAGWLKFFAITILALLWFRLESFRFLSMKFWWVIYALAFLCFLITKIRYYLQLDHRIEKGKKERR